MADRKYNDKEVGEILKAAAEMQSGMLSSSGPEGLTLQELQKVATEIGLEADHIELAAKELLPTAQAKQANQSDALSIERNVRGDLSDESWQDLVAEMQSLTGQGGQVVSHEGTREWSGGSDLGSMVLSVTSRRGRTRIRLLGNTTGFTAMSISMGIAFGIILTLMPVVFAVKQHPTPNPMVTFLLTALVALGCVAGVARMIRTNRSRFHSKLESVMTTLANVFESSQNEIRTVNLAVQQDNSAPKESEILRLNQG